MDEWKRIQWTEDRKKEDPRYPNDLSDAGLYGWRECYHWLYEEEVVGPDYGTEEYWEHEADRMEQQEVDELARVHRIEDEEDADLFGGVDDDF